jgi:hypothetical protein
MTEDKIRQLIQELRKIKDELRSIKKDLRDEEKIDSEEYIDLEKAYKDLKKQIKDFKDQWEKELFQDESYTKLREIKLKKEEEIGDLNEQLCKEIAKLPPRPFDTNLETEQGPIRVQIQPEMRLYLNGKEEKIKLSA